MGEREENRDLGDDIAGFSRGPGLPSHFYFHVPFCRSKCAYCDFASIAGADPQAVFAVFSGMEAELRRWGVSMLPGVVETVYFGGGTPSLHVPQVLSVLECVHRDLPLRAGVEVTVEANPDSLSRDSVAALAEAGVTRISVGVQAFDASVLQLLGRCHDSRQALDACEAVADARLELSVDVICGVPGQSRASWESTLELAIGTGAKHVSVYPLSVEAGTPLAVAVDTGLIEDADPDEAEAMMLIAEEMLGAAGLRRYEVANYAVPGHESRHNSAYWSGESYAGVGPGAHGMVDVATARAVGILPPGAAEDTIRVRYAEATNIDGWLTGGLEVVELLNAGETAREDVMLRLRLATGVSVKQAREAGLEDVMASLAEDGLVERSVEADGWHWRTTRRGWLLGNEVFGRVWNGEG